MHINLKPSGEIVKIPTLHLRLSGNLELRRLCFVDPSCAGAEDTSWHVGFEPTERAHMSPKLILAFLTRAGNFLSCALRESIASLSSQTALALKATKMVEDEEECFKSRRDESSKLLSLFNSIHHNPLFITELEKENNLPFLEVVIHRLFDGSFSFSIYLKKLGPVFI